MKIRFFVSLVCFVLGIGVSKSQYPYTLEGKAPAQFNNKKLYLLIEDNYSDQRYRITDSATVRNNSFSFKGILDKPSEYARLSANAKDISGFFYLAVDTGLNKVVIRPLAPKAVLYKNKLSNSQVLHSTSNKIVRAIDSLMVYYYQTKGQPSVKNKYLIQLSKEHFNELKRKQIEVIKSNPATYYSLIQTFKYLRSGLLTADEGKEVLASLSEELQQSGLAKTMQEYIARAKSTQVGAVVPIFTLQTNQDSTFSNKSLSGKPYILAFGATWCQPCKEKMPLLRALHEKYKIKNLEVVYVNLDGQTELWKKQIDLYKMDQWINVSDGVKWKESELARRFDVSGVPFYLVIDKNGRIVYNMNELNDYEAKKIDSALDRLENISY